MFDKVLIANRGEIAIRVIRTCRDLGIATVAVYSDADRSAKHVKMANEAVHIGPSESAASYLDVDKIIGAAIETGAQAIHPGYGFLSERADFARAVDDAGLVLIGPPPESMEQMGEKVAARKTAIAAEFPIVPGTTSELRSVDDVIEFGNNHGWPVAIKAAYGGGGRGLKVVQGPSGAADGLEGAQREGLSYFGSDICYVERYLDNAHHVEIQILADRYGNAVAIGERDCSTQRRNQKLIEESPAVVIDNNMRGAMYADATRLAVSVGYVGVGTIECLVQNDKYYFLEMNTRLQVEHCVTEEVHGIDLVEAQLRVASGDKLWFSQEDVVARGHSIECRINAEDPSTFMPTPGNITEYHAPSGPGIRVDAGFGSGDEINPFYDNLVAKLIVTGDNRDQARRRALRALREFEIGGLTTNIAAHQSILRSDDFARGRVTTRWVETVWTPPPAAPTTHDNHDADPGTPRHTGTPRHNPERRSVTVEVGNRRFDVTVWAPESGFGARPSKSQKNPKRRSRSRSAASSGPPGAVTAPMQGTVLGVKVENGQTVESGDALVVIEAMKMENTITSPADGVVSGLAVTVGDSVGAGHVVLVIE